MKRKLIAVSAVSVVVLCVLIGVGGNFAYKKNIENTLNKEMDNFYEYISNKESEYGYDFEREIFLTYDFLEVYSHENKDIESEVIYNARVELNNFLEDFLSTEIHALESLDRVKHIIYESSYVNDEIISEFRQKKKESAEFLSFIESTSDKDLAKMKKHLDSKVEVGYKENDVLDKLGSPKNTITSNSSLGETKIIEYEDKFIYTKDGVVTRVVDF